MGKANTKHKEKLIAFACKRVNFKKEQIKKNILKGKTIKADDFTMTNRKQVNVAIAIYSKN